MQWPAAADRVSHGRALPFPGCLEELPRTLDVREVGSEPLSPRIELPTLQWISTASEAFLLAQTRESPGRSVLSLISGPPGLLSLLRERAPGFTPGSSGAVSNGAMCHVAPVCALPLPPTPTQCLLAARARGMPMSSHQPCAPSSLFWRASLRPHAHDVAVDVGESEAPDPDAA